MSQELDAMLSSRLKLLDRNLERIVQVCDWRKRELEFTAYPVDGDVWNRAFRSVRARAQVIQKRASITSEPISPRAERTPRVRGSSTSTCTARQAMSAVPASS